MAMAEGGEGDGGCDGGIDAYIDGDAAGGGSDVAVEVMGGGSGCEGSGGEDDAAMVVTGWDGA
jgi:hypothetical protein